MSNGHFSTSGPYTVDPRTAFYHQQDEARRVRERCVRAELWLADRMQGKTFPNETAMREAVTNLAVILGYSLDDELTVVINTAVASLWQSPRFHQLTAAA